MAVRTIRLILITLLPGGASLLTAFDAQAFEPGFQRLSVITTRQSRWPAPVWSSRQSRIGATAWTINRASPSSGSGRARFHAQFNAALVAFYRRTLGRWCR
jgi:hypothetical protein